MIKNINKIMLLIIGVSFLGGCTLQEKKETVDTTYNSSTDLSAVPEITLEEVPEIIEENTFKEDKLNEADEFGLNLEKTINRASFKIKNDSLYGERLEAVIENTTDMIFTNLAFQVKILDSDNVLLGNTQIRLEGFAPGQKRFVSLENLPDSAKNIAVVEFKYLGEDTYVIVPVNPDIEDSNDIGKEEIIETMNKVSFKKEVIPSNGWYRFSGVAENNSNLTFTNICYNVLFFDKNGICLGSDHIQLEDLMPNSKYKLTATLDSYAGKNVASAKAVIHSYTVNE